MKSSTRHNGFLDALSTSAASSDWDAIATAYRTLRLIDAWAVGAPASEIRTAIAQTLDTRIAGELGQWLVPAVCAVADVLGAAGDFPDNRSSIAWALHSFSNVLSQHTEHRLGLDVAHLAIEHASGSPAVAWQCHRVCAFAHRFLSNLNEADAHYQMCVDIGKTIGDEVAIFRGDHGRAMVTCNRGDLPAAERAFRELVDRATQLADPILLSCAQHELGLTLGRRGFYAESLVQFEACLPNIEPHERDNALANIAYTHVALGNYDTARNAYYALADSTTSHVVRITSRINLIQIYGSLGQRDEVEQQKRMLLGKNMPIYSAADFWLTLGRAYVVLGDLAEARPCLERSVAIGHQAGLGQVIIEADRALADIRNARPIKSCRLKEPIPSAGEEVELGCADPLLGGSRS